MDEINPELNASMEEAFKKVEADMLTKLGQFFDEAVTPILPKATQEQRADMVAALNAYMVEESTEASVHDALNDVVDVKVKALVTQELGVDSGDEHDKLCDLVCDAMDNAVDETAIYGQLKSHEMMGEMFGLKSTGPVRVEDGEIVTTVAMGGAVRNEDGSWTEFGDELPKAD